MNNQIQLVLKSSTTELSLNDRELGIYLTPELDGLTGLPEIRTTSGVNAGYDGGWTSAQNYDARSITIRGVIANEDVATVEQLRRQLTTLAGQGKNEELTLDLVTQAGKAYTIQVRTIALEMSLQKVLTQQEFMLQLRADDPLIYDASETTHEALLQVAQATGGFTIDFELPLAITGSSEETIVNNEGLEQVPTVTRMYGELHNPKIINQTTNQFMQIEADLGFAEGDWTTPSEPVEGKNLTINDAPENAPLSDFKLKGETSQDGAPTPDAPVAVQTVTGENVVKICRKNLYDGSISETGKRLSTSTGGSYTDANYDISSYIPVQPNTTYTITTQGRIFCDEYTDGKSFIVGHAQTYGVTDPITITTASNTRYIRFDFPTGNNVVSQLELGSTATAYEPYQGQSYEINLGKNLFDKDNANVLNAYFALPNDQTITSNAMNRTLWIPCEPSTSYTFQAVGSNWKRQVGYTQDTPAVGVTVYGITNLNANATSISITTGASARYLVFRFWHQNNSTETYQQALDSIQIEKGSTATSYAPYFAPIELCKIGTYQDYIWKDGDTWKIHKEIGYTLHTGNVLGIAANNYSGETTVSATGAFFVWVGNISLMSENLGTLNDGAISGNADANAMTNGTFATRSGTPDRLYFRNTAYTGKTGNEMKAILEANSGGASVWYALATPTDTEITNEALIEQLDAILQEARMYSPQTNITTLYAEGNEQGTLSISYFTDKNPDTRDELVIDSRLRTITLNGLDVYHLQAPGSEFLMLAPGENRLSLQSDITGDNGYAQVSYKQGYLSI